MCYCWSRHCHTDDCCNTSSYQVRSHLQFTSNTLCVSIDLTLSTSVLVSTGMGDQLWVQHCVCRPTQPGYPSVDGCSEYWWWFDHCWAWNREFCVAVVRAGRTAGVLTESVKGAGCYWADQLADVGRASLIEFNHHQLRSWKELSCIAMDHTDCEEMYVSCWLSLSD